MASTERTTAPPAPRNASRVPVLLGGGAAVATATALVLPDAAWARAAIAVVLVATLVAVAIEDRAAAILATTGFLAVLGLVRRLVSMVQADPSNDPLLLVAPVVVALLALLALREGAHRQPSLLTAIVAVCCAVSVLAVANPHFPLAENLKGSLFWTVPLLWFPVGRVLVDDALMRRVLQLVSVLGIGACLTGVIQATLGFPPWDDRWIDVRGYIALGINGPDTLRPFGWSASAGEFALTAAIVAVLCGLQLRDAIRQRSPRLIGLFGIGLAVSSAALVLSAVRTAVLLGLCAGVIVAVASRRAQAGRAVAALALAVVVLVAGVRLLDIEGWEDGGIAGLARRSLLGLTDPLDPDNSTLRIHIDTTEAALRTLDDRPLGGGPAYGTTTPDDPEGSNFSAENDLGNAALAFGVPGLLLVLVLTVVGLRATWSAVRTRPDLLSLGVLGIMVASLRFWWTGAHYAPVMLIWLALGWTDRVRRAAS